MSFKLNAYRSTPYPSMHAAPHTHPSAPKKTSLSPSQLPPVRLSASPQAPVHPADTLISKKPGEAFVPPPKSDTPTPRSNHHSSFSWENYEKDSGHALHHYLQALGKPVIAGKKEKLLATFGVGWEGEKTVVASARSAAKRFDLEIDTLNLAPTERLRFGVAYRHAGKWAYACADDAIPQGARPANGALPDRIFYQFLAEGVFVMGGAEPGPRSKDPDCPRMPVIYHDLISHGGGLKESAQSHSALRQLGAHFMNPKNSDLQGRVYDAIETMAYIPKSNQNKLHSILPALINKKTSEELWEHTANMAQSMPLPAQSKLAQRLQQQVLPLILEVGGAARDGLGVEHSIVAQLEKTLNRGDAPLHERIADVHVALAALSKLDPQKWVDELIRPETFQDGLLQELFARPKAEWSRQYLGRYR